MGQVFGILVRCPVTKELFDTGIKTSGREALGSNAYQDGKISCRFCKQFHSLDEDAFLKVDQVRAGENLWRPNT